MNIDEIINSNYKNLNENDLYIWDYIRDNKKICVNMTIQELSKKCNVSHTTILRFTRKLGFDGYSELKSYLKWENSKNFVIKQSRLNLLYDSIIYSIEDIKNKDCTELFVMFDNAKKIYAYGSGDIQKNVAKFLKHSMLLVDKLVNVIEGSDETDVILNLVNEGDVFFLLSLSGNNAFINEFARKLKEHDVKIVSITKNGINELSKISDINIQFYSTLIDDDINFSSLFFVISELIVSKYMDYIKVKINQRK